MARPRAPPAGMWTGTAAPVEDELEAEAELVSPLKESKLEEVAVPEAEAEAVAAEVEVPEAVAEAEEELDVDLLLCGGGRVSVM